MAIHLKVLGSGVLALVGLLVVVGLMAAHPSFLVPLGLFGTAFMFLVLLVISRGS